MTVRRFDPLRELLLLQERMNRVFEESLARGRPEAQPLRAPDWAPPADAFETADSVVVELELAGLEREDVEIRVRPDLLVVHGTRRASGGRPESFLRMERSHGAFSRAFHLPVLVDPEDVRARLDDGVLRIEMPKQERPRREKP